MCDSQWPKGYSKNSHVNLYPVCKSTSSGQTSLTITPSIQLLKAQISKRKNASHHQLSSPDHVNGKGVGQNDLLFGSTLYYLRGQGVPKGIDNIDNNGPKLLIDTLPSNVMRFNSEMELAATYAKCTNYQIIRVQISTLLLKIMQIQDSSTPFLLILLIIIHMIDLQR